MFFVFKALIIIYSNDLFATTPETFNDEVLVKKKN